LAEATPNSSQNCFTTFLLLDSDDDAVLKPSYPVLESKKPVMPPVVDADGPAQEHAMADVVLFLSACPDRPDLASWIKDAGPLSVARMQPVNEKSPEPREKTPEPEAPEATSIAVMEGEDEKKSLAPASNPTDVEMSDPLDSEKPTMESKSVMDSDSNKSTEFPTQQSTVPTIVGSPSHEKPLLSIERDSETDRSLVSQVRQIQTVSEATAQHTQRPEIKEENKTGKFSIDTMGGLAVAEELLAISKGAARPTSAPPAILPPVTDRLHPQSLHPTINTEHNHLPPKDKVQLPPISYALNSLAEMAAVRSPFPGPTPSLAQPHGSIGGSKPTGYAGEAANRQPLHHISTQPQGIAQQNSPPYLPQPLFQHRSPYPSATSGPYPPAPLPAPHSNMNAYTSELRNGTQLPTPTSPYYNTPNIERRESSTSTTTTTYLDTPSGPSTGETYGSGSDDTVGATHSSSRLANSVRASSRESQSGGFKCDFEGCKAAPFQTQYLLKYVKFETMDAVDQLLTISQFTRKCPLASP
jgi:hypothetical protein